MPRRPPPPSYPPADMPVLAHSRAANGLIPIEPERMSRVCAARLVMANEPTWRSDPTYNLRRPKPCTKSSV
jgi:hypothetical protein